MTAFLAASLGNAAAASLLALAALVVCQTWRNPFVNRGAWLAVLLKFVVPPLVLLPLVQLPKPVAPPIGLAEQQSEQAPMLAHESATTAEPSPLPEPVRTIAERERVAHSQPIIESPANPEAPTVSAAWPHLDPTPQRHKLIAALVIPLAIALWTTGSLALAGLAVMRIARFHASLSRARIAPHSWQRRARRLAAAAGLKRPPLVRLLAGRTPPLAWRVWRRSTIVLPAQLFARLSAAEAEAILAHEITHLRRRDDRLRWLELAVVAVWWWCPFAWLARRRLHEAEERCCDADALHTFPAAAAHYARALLATIDYLAPAPRLAVAGTPFMDRGALVRRFEMITNRRLPSPPSWRARTVLLLGAAAMLATTPTAIFAEAEPDDAQAASLSGAAAHDVGCTEIAFADENGAPVADDSGAVAIPDASTAGDLNPDTHAADGEQPAPSGDHSYEHEVDRAVQVRSFGGKNAPARGGIGLRAGPILLKMPDGRVVTAQIRSVGNAWLVVPDDAAADPPVDGQAFKIEARFLPRPRNKPADKPANPTAAPDVPSEPPSIQQVENQRRWDLSLQECIKLALQHDKSTVFVVDARSIPQPILSPRDKNMTPADFRAHLDNLARDVEDAYWELAFAHRDLEARKLARDQALETWRRVKALERVSSANGEVTTEAQTRSQYFHRRAQIEAALTNLVRIENRLRHLLGLSAHDGRLIHPSDGPSAAPVNFNWDDIHIPAEALENRPELMSARFNVVRREVQLAQARASLAASGDGDAIARRRSEAAVRHHELLLRREQAVLKDVELTVAHQLGDALRDVELQHGLAETNANRSVAADDEVEAVDKLYQVGRTSIDLVLDSQRRRAEATSAYHRSLADYARAVMRLHHRKGSALTRHGYRIAQ